LHLRAPSAQALEWRARTVEIRTAARKGRSPQQIAALHDLPLVAVERVLTPIEHPRISDPIELLQRHRQTSGTAPADVQLYWLGFLIAAGYIRGQGPSLTLVVTFGEQSRVCIESLIADLVTDHIRCEYCYSSIVGWQAYLREPSLCKALFPWGVPSDLHGDDSALLDDLPREFAVPFICGYVQGNWPFVHSLQAVNGKSFTVQGTPAVLARINSMIQRYWEVPGGKVIPRRDRTELRFSNPQACRAIKSQLSRYVSRVGPYGRPRARVSS
jgi:hypothetical protein